MSLPAQLIKLARQLYWRYSPGGRRITAGFGIALAMMAGLSVISYQNATRLTEDNQQVEQAYEVLNLLNEIEAGLVDAESARRGYFLFEDPLERTRYRLAVQSLQPKITSLKSALIQSETLQAEPLEQLIAQWLSLFQQSIDAFEQQKIEPSINDPLIIKTRETRRAVYQMLETLRTEEQRSMQMQRAQAQSTLRSRLQIEALGNILTFFILLGVYIILRRQNSAAKTPKPASARWHTKTN
jgi:CHASE3 domain sensor protein